MAGTDSSYTWITDADKAAFLALDCTDPATVQGGDPGDPNEAFVTCGTDPEFPGARYVLGPVELKGTDVTDATASPMYNSTGQVQPNEYQVNLSFSGEGGTKFGEVTTRLFSLYNPAVSSQVDRNRFAIVLDGLVISAPQTQAAILTGTATH